MAIAFAPACQASCSWTENEKILAWHHSSHFFPSKPCTSLQIQLPHILPSFILPFALPIFCALGLLLPLVTWLRILGCFEVHLRKVLLRLGPLERLTSRCGSHLPAQRCGPQCASLSAFGRTGRRSASVLMWGKASRSTVQSGSTGEIRGNWQGAVAQPLGSQCDAILGPTQSHC